MVSTEQTECPIWMIEGILSGPIVLVRSVERVVNNSAPFTLWREQEPSSSTLWLVPLQEQNGHGIVSVGKELLGIQRLSTFIQFATELLEVRRHSFMCTH
jgi:hypothetical protein